jgi:L-iditol 2-dehydrogenase
MRVVRFYAPRDIRVEDAPAPPAGPGDLVIRVRNCSTCGTDAKIWRSGHPNLRPPRVLGHEVAGEVVEVGQGADRWSVGDRVQVIAAIPDGTCHECRHGRMTVCPNQELIGYHYDGGFAERMRVPAKALAVDGVNRVPDGLSFAEASLAEPLSCVINGQEHARVGEGDTVVVVGAGPIGCLHVRLARARGAARVFLIELSRRRLEMAAMVAPDEAIGADTTSPASPRTSRPSPSTPTSSTTARWASSGPTAPAPDHNKQALGLIASGVIRVADLITHRLPLERAVEGIHTVTRGEAIKVTIEPTGDAAGRSL